MSGIVAKQFVLIRRNVQVGSMWPSPAHTSLFTAEFGICNV